ncbi:TetR family transcriptional regulator [Caballeronia terrestris]|jgi:AcrR family transcriptional regulator|uniref:TetR family transcriptional regulator n=1 Tax=Caballeronia terrestris TaxID=1226301 RepID=A0A158KE91_9BURK|nr:TetR/AcrR family transcriptional regulator [Caballeronia terrestris]SAL78870.1 TetR family transcriptional regulator [Caballeronia terrestris]
MELMSITSEDISGRDAKGASKSRGNRTTRVPEILEVAIRVFAREGNAGFTQRRVAADAGVRLSTLQHYFGSRESLLQSTIEEMGKRYLERFRLLADDALRSPEARLETLLDETFDVLTGPDNVVSPFALEVWCLAEHQASVRDLMVRVSGDFQEVFSKLVAEINPALARDECRLRGALIYSHWQGLIVFLRRSGRNAPDLVAFRTATKVVWKALSNASQ